MPKIGPEGYLSLEEYENALGPFQAISGFLLFELARDPRGNRDIIVSNFIARTHAMTGSIFALWKMGDYQDCWILFRCLLERLFLLAQLADKDEFDAFEAWSFREQFNALNKVRSNVPEARKSKLFSFTPDQVERARLLDRTPPKWKRSKPEDIAVMMKLKPLYDYGYDFASTHVHPMANDGLYDFFSITKLKPAPDFPDQRVILSNTLLVGTLIVQNGMNASGFSWRRIAFDFFDELLEYTDNGDKKFAVTFLKLGKLIESGVRLGEPIKK